MFVHTYIIRFGDIALEVEVLPITWLRSTASQGMFGHNFITRFGDIAWEVEGRVN